MMEHKLCLNCAQETSGKFCGNCGQKTDVHRITFGHFVMHDLLHGTFHLDRGILFTLKQALIRPGQAALDYIGGKRIRFYNVFYLSLILIGIVILMAHSSQAATLKADDPASERAGAFLTENIKLILLGFIPVIALNGKLLFWKMKLNLAEHFIVAGFVFVGVLVIVTLFVAVDTLIELTNPPDAVGYVLLALLACWLLFPCWAYGNLVWKRYSVLGFAWRIIVFYVLLFVEMIVLIASVLYLFTGQTEMSFS